jgi:GT2 family glycosyltransferase
MTPSISVVTPTFDRRSSLERLLGSLGEQLYPMSEFEVVVVDDGSKDGTVDHLRRALHPFRLQVAQQPHRGPAAARNLGVTRATGDLILFLDDDVVAAPDLIARHVAAHAASADSVVIGPMSPPVGWPRSVWVRWEEAKLQRQYEAMRNGDYACTPRQFFTANASLPRERFVLAGGFDPSYKRAEDVELGYRLRDLGMRFVFEADAEVFHYATRTFESWCRTPYQYGRGDVAMAGTKGHESLSVARHEFSARHPLSRALTVACVGRPPLTAGANWILGGVARACGRAGLDAPAESALSAIFSLLYWQGVCDELGGRQYVWPPPALVATR